MFISLCKEGALAVVQWLAEWAYGHEVLGLMHINICGYSAIYDLGSILRMLRSIFQLETRECLDSNPGQVGE